MIYELKPTPRLPVLVRVFTDAGEIIEHLARSTRAAAGYVEYHVREGYWYGAVVRIEYEYYKNYRVF